MATKGITFSGYDSPEAAEISPERVDADNQTIEIVRREVVGTVNLSPFGTGKPLQTAFEIAANYIAENDSPNGVALEFNLFGSTFRAIQDPVKP